MKVPKYPNPAIAEIARIPHWVGFRLQRDREGGDRLRKVPINPRTGRTASCNAQGTWASYREARDARKSDQVDLIGFALRGDFTVLDLDHCIEDGRCSQESQEIIDWLDSYTELSPSGTGVHIWLRGPSPLPSGRQFGHVEIYSKARFMTVTGHHVPGTPTEIQDRQEELRQLIKKLQAAALQREPEPQSGVAEGERHNRLKSEAARLQNAGVSPAAILAGLRGLNETVCSPPLPDEEVEGLARWAGDLPTDIIVEGKVNPARLARTLRSAGLIRLGDGGLLYRYEDGVYVADGEEWVRSEAKALLGDRFRKNPAEEAIYNLKSGHVEVSPERCSHPGIINCANGLLHWKSGRLEPHRPDFISMNQIPIAWKPDAAADQIPRVFAEIFGDERTVRMWLEICGYALYHGNPFRKAVLLSGPGGNGKSTVLHCLGALLGERNVSAVDLQSLGDNRFSTASLYGALANICGDLDVRTVDRTDVFKQLTGGDRVRAERKYGGEWWFRWPGLMLFSANEYPMSRDPSSAWFDRWLVLPCERKFEGTEDADPHLLKKLLRPEELEGLLVLAVEGLRRAMTRNSIAPSKAARGALTRYRQEADSVLAFMRDGCTIAQNRSEARRLWVPQSGLLESYQRWCDRERRTPLSAARFYRRVEHLARERGWPVERKKRGVRGFSGVVGVDDLTGGAVRFTRKKGK